MRLDFCITTPVSNVITDKENTTGTAPVHERNLYHCRKKMKERDESTFMHLLPLGTTRFEPSPLQSRRAPMGLQPF